MANKPYAWWWDVFDTVRHARPQDNFTTADVREAALAATTAPTREAGIDAGEAALLAARDRLPEGVWPL